MPASNLVIHEEDFSRITGALGNLRESSNARFVFLIDRSGQQLGFVGDTADLDATSLASLAAGNVAATEGLASVIGQSNFTSLFHEGSNESLHITLIDSKVILLVAFDERSSLGLVRLRVEQASDSLGSTLAEIAQRETDLRAAGGETASPLAEITDEDIDNLFSD
jgi:predicted regulator of Ras-like GTPase activity (Roadblock/LC7/MglB family)